MTAPNTGFEVMVAVRLVDWPTSEGLMELVSKTVAWLPTAWVGSDAEPPLGEGGGGVGRGDGVATRGREAEGRLAVAMAPEPVTSMGVPI